MILRIEYGRQTQLTVAIQNMALYNLKNNNKKNGCRLLLNVSKYVKKKSPTVNVPIPPEKFNNWLQRAKTSVKLWKVYPTWLCCFCRHQRTLRRLSVMSSYVFRTCPTKCYDCISSIFVPFSFCWLVSCILSQSFSYVFVCGKGLFFVNNKLKLSEGLHDSLNRPTLLILVKPKAMWLFAVWFPSFSLYWTGDTNTDRVQRVFWAVLEQCHDPRAHQVVCLSWTYF